MSTIWIDRSIYAQMLALAKQSFPYETGGMLVGWTADNRDVVVRAVIGPGPNAKHRRLRFSPDSSYQQQILESHFYATDGKETYLGDWHTHPDGAAGLSYKDKRTLARIADTASSCTRSPVMAIFAGRDEAWHFAAVRYLTRTRRFFFHSYRLEHLAVCLH